MHFEWGVCLSVGRCDCLSLQSSDILSTRFSLNHDELSHSMAPLIHNTMAVSIADADGVDATASTVLPNPLWEEHVDQKYP